MARSVRPALVLAALAAPVLAQTFQPGDLYLYNPAYQGSSSGAGAIVRIDPTTGAHTLLVDLATSSSGSDQMAYDPWRDRLIFFGGLVPNHNEVYLCDAVGGLQSLGLGVVSGPQLGRFAPRGDGLIYFTGFNAPSQISYFDAANQVHALMDASGAAAFAFPGGPGAIRRLEYHAPTNALVAAVGSEQSVCSGGATDAVSLHVLELSGDGSRVLASACFQYDLDPGAFGEIPAGLAPGPGGDLILHVDDNSTSELWRVARVDPALRIVVPFASNSIAATSSGSYSQVLGRAILHDSGDDVLRAYAFGEGGLGTVISTGTGTGGGTGETATLVEIVPGVSSFGMTGNPGALSVSAGGVQSWSIALGAAHAGELHLVAGSFTGWTPATVFSGVPIPLVLDAYTLWTLNHQNSAVLQGTLGVLDGSGAASAALVLPPAADPNLIGITAYHATLALAGGGAVTAATNPVPLVFLP